MAKVKKVTRHERLKNGGALRSGVHFAADDADVIRAMAEKAGVSPTKYVHDVTVAAAQAGMIPARTHTIALRSETEDD